MEISANYSGTYFAGIGLTLTCTVTLDPNVDSSENVLISWSGPRHIPGERYLVIEASGFGQTHSGGLIISPLAKGEDDGQYTCNITVGGGSSVLGATGSNNTFIDVIGIVDDFALATKYVCIIFFLSPSSTSCACSEQFHCYCWD